MSKNPPTLVTVFTTVTVCACALWMIVVWRADSNSPTSVRSETTAREPGPLPFTFLQDRLEPLAAPTSSTPSSQGISSDSNVSDGRDPRQPVKHLSIRPMGSEKRLVPHFGSTSRLESPSPQSSSSKYPVASLATAGDFHPELTGDRIEADSQPTQPSTASATEVHQPIIFIDPGSLLPDDPARDAILQSQAEELVARINAGGLDQDSPEYREHWNRLAQQSNQLLRQQYGGRVWTAHHIQAHHLRSASGSSVR